MKNFLKEFFDEDLLIGFKMLGVYLMIASIFSVVSVLILFLVYYLFPNLKIL